jgi:hypothetical protein
MTKAKTPKAKAKKYTRRATNKNVKCDDLIASRKNEIFRVWSEAGGMTSIPVLHALDARRKFRYQSPRDLMAIKDGAPFFHLGEKYVEPPPKVPKPTEKYVDQFGHASLGWIAPDGRFFGCNYGAHNSLSYQLHFHEIDNKAERGIGYIDNDNEIALEEAGWLKVFTGSGSGPRIGHPEPHVRELSRAQGDTILLYSSATKTRPPYWLDPVTYEVK